jgi:uncharacterized protein YbaP (TraB family)
VFEAKGQHSVPSRKAETEKENRQCKTQKTPFAVLVALLACSRNERMGNEKTPLQRLCLKKAHLVAQEEESSEPA